MKNYKLFCLPYAGGSANNFYKWKKDFKNSIDIVPVELAGRGRRIDEPPYQTIDQAVNDIYNCIYPYLKGKVPYAILGHSMGACLAYELTLKIGRNNNTPPDIVFLSGSNPPEEKSNSRFGLYPDNKLIEKLYELGGLKEEILHNKELLEIFLPIIKADLKMIESYRSEKKKINCNIIALNGLEDNFVNIGNIEQWSNYTTKDFHSFIFPGDHFFINTSLEKVSMTISEILLNSTNLITNKGELI